MGITTFEEERDQERNQDVPVEACSAPKACNRIADLPALADDHD